MIPAPPPATSTISHSIVSPHAHISAHSRISRSLILPNARIGANCTLDTCIIGPNAVVEDGTTLERGCVIGAGARVGPGTIESGSLILTRDDDEDEEEEEDSGKLGRIGTRPETPVDETSDEEGDESSDEELDLNKLVGKSSKLTSAQIATARSELKQTLIRAIAESHSINDCFAEIKTTKMAENASWTDVRLIVCRELVELGVKQGWKAAAKWGGLVALCIMDRTKAADGKEVVEFFAVRILVLAVVVRVLTSPCPPVSRTRRHPIPPQRLPNSLFLF